jgi:hypothetical protein
MNGRILVLLVGGAIGYVIGARQGRPAYDKLARQARDVWEKPQVQKTVGQAQEFVKNVPLVGEMASDAVDRMKPEHASSSAGGPGSASATGSGSATGSASAAGMNSGTTSSTGT